MNKVAIVTGASSGIGRATALQLAEAGFDVGITYCQGDARARAVAKEIELRGVRSSVAPLELADPQGAATTINQLADTLGALDVFVHCAGINHRKAFIDTSIVEWSRVLAVNLTGAFLCAQAAAQRMRAQGRGGCIVNVSSILDRQVLEGGAAYCASKAAVSQLTRVMALELAAEGIRVNAVAPGETATPMNFSHPEDAASLHRPVTPLGRPARAQEIASVIAFLVSEGASYMTGEVLLVDGGLALHGGPQALQKAVGNPAPLAASANRAVGANGSRP